MNKVVPNSSTHRMPESDAIDQRYIIKQKKSLVTKFKHRFKHQTMLAWKSKTNQYNLSSRLKWLDLWTFNHTFKTHILHCDWNGWICGLSITLSKHTFYTVTEMVGSVDFQSHFQNTHSTLWKHTVQYYLKTHILHCENTQSNTILKHTFYTLRIHSFETGLETSQNCLLEQKLGLMTYSQTRISLLRQTCTLSEKTFKISK